MTLKDSEPSTRQAIITFERQSVQMFFSPEHALEDFRRKVKELWNIPRNHYYLKVNGIHEDAIPQIWKDNTTVRVEIKGLLGGAPIRYRYATRYEGKRTKGSGPVIQTAKEIAEKLKIPLQGLRVNHGGHVLPMSATLRDIFGDEDNGTFDFEKGRVHEITIEHPKGIWKGFGKGEQTFTELATLKCWELDDGELLRDDGEIYHAGDQIKDAANWESSTLYRWTENEEKTFQKGAGLYEDDAETFYNYVSITLIHGNQELEWKGQPDIPISLIQDENWFANDVTTAWTIEGESYPCDTPVGVILGDEPPDCGTIWLGEKPTSFRDEPPDVVSDG
jgi:hypothetical protein